jgi:large subunit ribosomal protein L22
MTNNDHIATAKGTNLNLSTKQCVEICNVIRFTPLSTSKVFLEDVIAMRKAVPFRKFNKDMGHKRGPMAAGRYPIKASKQILLLLKSVEANAQAKGLNTSNLKITKILANKASIPQTGGRNRQGTKRSHVEIEVQEYKNKKSKDAKVSVKKSEAKPVAAEPVKEAKTEEPAKEESTPEPVVEEEKAEEPAKEESTLEPVVEEEKAEEPAKEESTPEPVVEEEKAEEPAKEESIPEPVVEEEKAEEPAKEESQSEEETSEPVEEETTVEKAPVEEKIEEPVSEPKVEEPVEEAPVKEEKTEVPSAAEQLVEEPTPQILKETPVQMNPKEVKDLSPQDLLQKAQEHAAILNKKEVSNKETKEVENLYEQLQKKGSLRDEK